MIAPHRVIGSGAAALLATPDNRYLMQLRDERADIWFPGHWGLFGGAVDDEETPQKALCRELDEELGLIAREVRYFSQVVFDLGDPSAGFRRRFFYEVPISESEIAGLTLREGQLMRSFSAAELLSGRLPQRLVPYDAFGIMLHLNRRLLIASGHLP